MDDESSQPVELASGELRQLVDDRGHITLFDGITATIRIRKNGTAKKIWRPPTWSLVKKIDYICGETLDRVAVLKKEKGGTVLTVATKLASDSQREIQCDACPKKHSPNNPSCSANLGIKTFARKRNHLYNFQTRQDCGEWMPNISFIGAAKVGSGTFSRR